MLVAPAVSSGSLIAVALPAPLEKKPSIFKFKINSNFCVCFIIIYIVH